jgi:hypothetical protein
MLSVKKYDFKGKPPQFVLWTTWLINMKAFHIRYSSLHVSISSPHSEGIEGCGGTAHTTPYILNPGTRQSWSGPCPAALTLVGTKLEPGLASDVWNLWRWQRTSRSHKLMYDSLVIQLTAVFLQSRQLPRDRIFNMTHRMKIQSAFTLTWARSIASVTSPYVWWC